MAAPMSRKICSQIFSLLPRLSRCAGCQALELPSPCRYASSYCQRSHTCGELRASHVGSRVRLKGWVHHQRFGMFLVLRDAYGTVQLLMPDEKSDMVKSLSMESVISVEGTVAARREGQQNKNMATGDIEVLVDRLDILNASKTVPFNTRTYDKIIDKTNQLLKLDRDGPLTVVVVTRTP